MEDVLCPGKWEISEAEERSFDTAIKTMDREYYAYNKILTLWNRKVAENPGKAYNPGDFVSFLLESIGKVASKVASKVEDKQPAALISSR